MVVRVAPSEPVTWSVTGRGTVSPASGTQTTFTAGDRASTSTVRAARADGCTCTLVFTVVEPDGAYQVQTGSTIHNPGTCSAGFQGITYLTPRDVSFEWIEINEGVCNSTANGSFATAGWNNLRHPPWPSWAAVSGSTDATGSRVEGPNTGPPPFDHIFSGALPANCASGEFTWVIPWRFRVSGGAEKTFTQLTHHAVADGARRMTMSKGGVSVSATEP